MKNKLKFIIPVVIAVIAIIVAALCIDFEPAERVDIPSLMSTAQKYLIENNYEQAIAEFNKIIEIDPMNADAYIGITDAYIGMGDTEKAIEWLEKGYELTGDERLKNIIDKLKSENSVEKATVTTAIETEVTTTATAPENEIVKNDDGSYYEMAFNTAGNIIHEDFYDENGNWWGSADIEYYPNGNKKKVTYLREDGTYYVTEYDENENKMETTSYNADGSIYFYEIFEYDSNGNMLSNTSYYGDDDSLRTYYKYEYDSNNYEVYFEYYDSIRHRKETFTDEYMWEEYSGKCNIKYNGDYTVVYTYNLDGKSGYYPRGGEKGIKECYAYPGNDESCWHYIYEFDESNRKISTKGYFGDNSYSHYEKYSYDSKDNVISIKIYTGNMELTSYVTFIHDGLGNPIVTTEYNSDGSIRWKEKY